MARVRRTRIGSPFVIDAMQTLASEGARIPVGYEANGGFLLGGPVMGPGGVAIDPLPTRDAMLPVIAVLAAAGQGGLPLSALRRQAPRRVTASDRLQDVPAEASAPFLTAVAQDPSVQASLLAPLGAPTVRAVDTLDGVRLTLDSGDIVHLRASGNAPELRCYAEAETAEGANRLVQCVMRSAAGLLV